MTNPLIEQGDLLAFDNLAPSCVTPAVRVLIAEVNEVLSRVTDKATPATWLWYFRFTRPRSAFFVLGEPSGT